MSQVSKIEVESLANPDQTVLAYVKTPTKDNPDAIRFFSSFDTSSHLTIIVFLLIGTVITCIVQSSAAVMAITILLCSTGVLPIYLGIALVMGENIGTTVTSNIAAFKKLLDMGVKLSLQKVAANKPVELTREKLDSIKF